MTQYQIVITVGWLSIVLPQLVQHYTVIPQLLKYDTESFHSYYNTVLNHSIVIAIRYWVIPHLLKYDTESYQSYYNTILSHSRVNTIRPLITPQLLQYDTESFQLLQYDTETYHSYYNTILGHSTDITIVITGMTQYRIVITTEWLSIVF
jgi:hypothetical protein